MSQNSISDQTLKIILRDLDEKIAETKRQLAHYQQARSEFEALHRGYDPKQKTPTGRLPRGVPAKLVSEAMSKYKRLTIGEVMRKVEEDTGTTIRDASARRALRKMAERGTLRREENGVYVWIEEEQT